MLTKLKVQLVLLFALELLGMAKIKIYVYPCSILCLLYKVKFHV